MAVKHETVGGSGAQQLVDEAVDLGLGLVDAQTSDVQRVVRCPQNLVGSRRGRPQRGLVGASACAYRLSAGPRIDEVQLLDGTRQAERSHLDLDLPTVLGLEDSPDSCEAAHANSHARAERLCDGCTRRGRRAYVFGEATPNGEMPSDLVKAIESFVNYYNYRRYHEGLGDVTPYDVYTGRHLEIKQRRKEVKDRTLLSRRDYNRKIREHGSSL